jgi:hypothetical protein
MIPHLEAPSGFRHDGRRPNQWQPEDHSGVLVAAVIFLIVLAGIVTIYSTLL